MPRHKLDFDTLYGKAFKVTDPEGDPSREGFSVVTLVNGDVFNQWKERPQYRELVRKRLNEPDFLADYKYDQIVESAKKLGLPLPLKRGTAMDFDVKALAKTARVLDESDLPNGNPELQTMVGDPNDYRSSTWAQFKPNPGNTQLPNPLSPIEGDEMFFAYMIPGAKFQARDGSQWNILDYPWQGIVHIENVWYPRINAQVSLNDVRRSIEQWVEPVQVFIAAPAPGIDYGALPVRIVDGPANYGGPDSISKGEGGYSTGGSDVSGGW